MKFKRDKKNGNTEFEFGVENLVEKGMNIHDKNWKDKFSTKHDAEKEMIELKHQQMMELEAYKIEEQRKLKELEYEEKKMQIEIEERKRKPKIIASIILGLIGTVLMTLGYLMAAISKDPESGWYGVAGVGFMFFIAIIIIWKSNKSKND